MYMWPPTSHFLPTKQLTVDKRDELSDSENNHLISDEHNHTSEGALTGYHRCVTHFLLPNLNFNLNSNLKSTGAVPKLKAET